MRFCIAVSNAKLEAEVDVDNEGMTDACVEHLVVPRVNSGIIQH